MASLQLTPELCPQPRSSPELKMLRSIFLLSLPDDQKPLILTVPETELTFPLKLVLPPMFACSVSGRYHHLSVVQTRHAELLR